MDQITRERLTEAARACRILDMEGHGDMTLGHLSVRAEDGGGFWMKRNRIGLGEVLGPEDFVLLDWDGKQLAGDGGHHTEWPIHSEIFLARTDVNVVVHSHPLYASIFSAAVEPLQPYTLDADYLIDVPRHEADVALLAQKSQGAALAHALGQHFAVFIANHGVTFCGTTIEHAVCVGIFLEKACRAHLIGAAANVRATMPDRAVRERRRSEIMRPVHWEHCWRYFCRKLDAHSGLSGSGAVFG